MSTFANNEDLDEMQHNTAFHQGAHSEDTDEMQHNAAF